MTQSEQTLLLSTAYFPPVQYLAFICQYPDVLIEKHENYSKQSYRNRCKILSANGVLPLVIPVKRFRGIKTSVAEIKPDNSYSWQRLHMISIESAYRSAPFYEYYIDDIRPFLEKKYKYLLDLNGSILDMLISVLDLPARWKFTSSFISGPQSEIIDLRFAIHPKKSPEKFPVKLNYKDYFQVFINRHGFQPDMSILDLLFNIGPDSSAYLRQIIK
jgi:hypothetical protein